MACGSFALPSSPQNVTFSHLHRRQSATLTRFFKVVPEKKQLLFNFNNGLRQLCATFLSSERDI